MRPGWDDVGLNDFEQPVIERQPVTFRRENLDNEMQFYGELHSHGHGHGEQLFIRRERAVGPRFPAS